MARLPEAARIYMCCSRTRSRDPTTATNGKALQGPRRETILFVQAYLQKVSTTMDSMLKGRSRSGLRGLPYPPHPCILHAHDFTVHRKRSLLSCTQTGSHIETEGMVVFLANLQNPTSEEEARTYVERVIRACKQVEEGEGSAQVRHVLSTSDTNLSVFSHASPGAWCSCTFTSLSYLVEPASPLNMHADVCSRTACRPERARCLREKRTRGFSPGYATMTSA